MYELCLSIPTHINTSIASTVRYLLSMMQASLEAAWLHIGRIPGAGLGMRKNGYLQVISRIIERNFHDAAQNNGWNSTVDSPGSPQANNRILKKAKSILCCCEWPAVNFIWAFLIGFTSSHEWYNIDIYIHTKNYKAVNIYHQVTCYPESVNAKQGNPVVYSAIFKQCICTGYC